MKLKVTLLVVDVCIALGAFLLHPLENHTYAQLNTPGGGGTPQRAQEEPYTGIQTTGTTSDITTKVMAGDSVVFTINASDVGGVGTPLEYEFWTRAGYGEQDWGGNSWERIQAYGAANTVTHTFATPGIYVLSGHIIFQGETWEFGWPQTGIIVEVLPVSSQATISGRLIVPPNYDVETEPNETLEQAQDISQVGRIAGKAAAGDADYAASIMRQAYHQGLMLDSIQQGAKSRMAKGYEDALERKHGVYVSAQKRQLYGLR